MKLPRPFHKCQKYFKFARRCGSSFVLCEFRTVKPFCFIVYEPVGTCSSTLRRKVSVHLLVGNTRWLDSRGCQKLSAKARQRQSERVLSKRGFARGSAYICFSTCSAVCLLSVKFSTCTFEKCAEYHNETTLHFKGGTKQIFKIMRLVRSLPTIFNICFHHFFIARESNFHCYKWYWPIKKLQWQSIR